MLPNSKSLCQAQSMAEQKLRPYLVCLGICALALLLVPTLATALPFLSSEHKFSLEIPDEMNLVSAQEPSVPLLLKAKGGAFPTFNIVVQAGSTAVQESSQEKLSSSILDDYRRVGIIDAKLLNSWKKTYPSGEMLVAEIQYSLSGQIYWAQVGIISGSDRTYTLTLIDKKTPSEYLWNALANSLSLFSPFTKQAKTADFPWLFLGLVLAVALAAFVVIRRKA